MSSEEHISPALFRVLVGLFILSVAINAILIAKRSLIFPSKNTLISERNALDERLTQSLVELSKYKGISQDIDKVVKQAHKQLEDKEIQILKLQADGKTTIKQNKQLLLEIDSLKNNYLTSIDSLLIIQQRNRIINEKLSLAQNHINNLELQLGLSQQLIADQFIVEGRRENKSGKKLPSALAKRTNGMKICFDIIQNKVARSGDYDLYVVVTAPNGTVLKSDDWSDGNVFQHPEYYTPAKYSMATTFDYQNQKMSVCQDLLFKQQLFPGLYVVEIFTPTSKLGMTTLNLR